MRDLREILKSRRSCRSYSNQPVSGEQIEALIADAVWAPSGSNHQPWRFLILQDAARLKRYSDLSKETWLAGLDRTPELRQYEGYLRNPDFNIFYEASTLVVIYGSRASPWFVFDCTMVAYNLMLLAEADGLGSCWIGFAHNIFDTEPIKHELEVPAKYQLVAPILLGHPAGPKPANAVPRKPYVTKFFTPGS